MKVNREKSIRVGILTLSIPLIMSLSNGCVSKKKVDTSNNIKNAELLLNNSKKTQEVKRYIDLANQVNEYLKSANLQGEKKEIEGVEYYNYTDDNININDYTIDELEDIIKNFQSLSSKEQKHIMAYLNKVNYYNNLYVNYENFYRLILADSTNNEYISLQDDEESHIYIEEDKKLVSNNKKDYTVLMKHYNIDEYSASILLRLINNAPSIRFMVKHMNNGENLDFGTEDYIPELLEKTRKSADELDICTWKYQDYKNKDKKKKNIDINQEQRLSNYNNQLNNLEDLLKIYKEANNNNLSTDFRRVDETLIYKNYPSNDIKEKEEYYTIKELEAMLSKFDTLPDKGKLDLIAHINKTVNKYNLEEAFEGLYREILTSSCGIDYTDLQKIEDKSYLEDGKAIVEKYNDINSIEVLINYYGIGENEASLLLKLIETKPNLNDLYELMKKDSEFGTEDYIPAYSKKLQTIINTYRSIESIYRELYSNKYTKKRVL